MKPKILPEAPQDNHKNTLQPINKFNSRDNNNNSQSGKIRKKRNRVIKTLSLSTNKTIC